MTYPTIPKLDLPFRLNPDGTFHAIEQDTTRDILNACRLITATPKGFHEWEPRLGITPLEFQQAGPDLDLLQAEIEQWEPRASILTDIDLTALAAGEARLRLDHDG